MLGTIFIMLCIFICIFDCLNVSSAIAMPAFKPRSEAVQDDAGGPKSGGGGGRRGGRVQGTWSRGRGKH